MPASTKKKSAATIAEEAVIAREIAKADYFTAFLRVGPHEKYIERRDTYEEAKQAGEALRAQHSAFGRRPVIYAVNKLGSFDCTDELVAMARAL